MQSLHENGTRHEMSVLSSRDETTIFLSITRLPCLHHLPASRRPSAVIFSGLHQYSWHLIFPASGSEST
ncbi:uncharacterized protein QC761_0016070 [Podospora bellae-mahoneyi]|uniref:Uncharacterized protein n=1 Tax=Podospora bellae-mahoneyi TaxID=2093777 RepID=A0ABR0FZQ8_9PEZI|nr:hypothetical protein QC761_0016070 [Podospora bellae-mahoneyi]